MSNWRAEIEDIEEPSDLVDFVGSYYHVPTVLLLLVFMFWARVRNWKRFIVDGTVFFPGNDPWYHYRMTTYTVKNWPETSPFDPWTYFPIGANSGQFGTMFDQLIATAALVVGLGNPSDHTIRMVLLFAPPVFGTAAAIPTYYIGKRAGGRLGAVVSIGVLALVGSTFASRGTVGTADHQIAEAFFQIVAVLGTMVAVSVAQEEKPIYELFAARDVAALRRPVGWAIIAGFAIALYIWTWPPGVLLLGILGIYYLLELSSEYAHGESPEHVAIVGAISLSVAGVLTLAALEGTRLSPTGFTLLQPGLAFAVAGGCLFLAWLARQWDTRDLPTYQYPIGVASIIVVLAGSVAVVLPGLFDFFVNQITRVAGLGLFTTETAGTVGEAQPLRPQPIQQLYAKYRFTIFIAGVGGVYILAKQFISKTRAELLLLVVWLVMAIATTITQRRFDYYLAAPVAVLTGLVIGRFASFADLRLAADEIEAYQVITVVAVAILVFAPLVFPTALAMGATNKGVGSASPAWNESLGWMQTNTPAEGEFAGANNGMEYYGTFAKADDYDYPEGSYGVLSWWDYGHWITTMGERIPTANPFQQGANEAANFLLSTNESHANEVADRLSEGENTQTRYVMVDWKMVSTETSYQTARGSLNLQGKYFAPFAFYDDGPIDQSDYYLGRPRGVGLLYQTDRGSYRTFSLKKQSYYESTAVRLYRFHGSAVEPRPIAITWEQQSIQGRQFPVSTGVRSFGNNMTAAREFVENNVTAQIGGIGPYPQERVPALENYRLVQVSETSAYQSRRYIFGLDKVARGAFETNLVASGGGVRRGVADALHRTQPAWVKTFERVPGATVQGTGPANTTVSASVEMAVPGSNSTFTYRQRTRTDADGSFTMTLPYSTTGYEEWTAEEGYTNPRVRATGPYVFQTRSTLGQADGNISVVRYNGTAQVAEGQVIGTDDDPVEVRLEQEVVSRLGSGSSGNQGESGSGGSGQDGTSGGSGDLAPRPGSAGGSDDARRVEP